MIKQGETPETDALWVDDAEIPSVKKVTELCRSLERRLHEAEKEARRFVYLQNCDPKHAQQFFWNYSSRKQRAAAIDAEIDK